VSERQISHATVGELGATQLWGSHITAYLLSKVFTLADITLPRTAGLPGSCGPPRDGRLPQLAEPRISRLQPGDCQSPVLLASSDEPKAVETTSIFSKRLGLSIEIVPDLHEHERPNGPHLDAAAFQAAITRFFAHPEEIVCGAESANRALAGDTLLVTHGTVLALFVAAITAKNSNVYPQSWDGEAVRPDAHTLWRALGREGEQRPHARGKFTRHLVAR